MTKNCYLFILLLVIANCPAISEIIGGYTTDYMDYGVGARIMAMGGAGRSVVKDASSGYWNSGILPNLIDLSFSAMSTTILGTTKYDYMGASFPLSRYDTFAVNYVSLMMDNLEIHTQTNNPSATPEGYFNVSKKAVIVSYGRKVLENLNLGVSCKYGMRNIYNSADNVIALDIGYFWDLGTIKVGGNVRNVFAQMFGDASDDKYELDADIGASMQVEKLTLSFDLARLMRSKSIDFYAGAEYELMSINDNIGLTCRAGINSNEMSLGLGCSFVPIVIDYAYLIRSYGSEYMLSFGLQFDDNFKKENLQKAEQYYKEALAELNENNLAKATELVNQGVRISREHANLKKLKYRMDQGTYYLNLKPPKNSNQNDKMLFSDAVFAFFLMDYDKAEENLEYLIFKHDDREIRSFRDIVENDSKKVYKYKNKNIIGIYLEDSIASVLVDNIDKSTQLLEKATYFEPDNTLALKRLGSNYFIKNDSKKALEIWKKVLDIDPNDKEVKYLIEKAIEKNSEGSKTE
ncbi:MAG: hypothetical protein PHV30_06755 [Candidatus Margulisbacteria bacterium]|nr:hypothetical protein [Candidatus Margulisiibacteriota bacterium]